MLIAILEDDIHVASHVENALVGVGHTAHIFETGTGLLSAIESRHYDFFILDWHLPDFNAEIIIESLRVRHGSRSGIIMMTQYDRAELLVNCLKLGADDYICKPVNADILLARIGAIVRRIESLPANRDVLQIGPYKLHASRRVVELNSLPVRLSGFEFDLCYFLFSNIGRLISRCELARRIWGKPEVTMTRTIDQHIYTLRRKLRLAENNMRLTSVYGAGYRLEIAGDVSAVA